MKARNKKNCTLSKWHRLLIKHKRSTASFIISAGKIQHVSGGIFLTATLQIIFGWNTENQLGLGRNKTHDQI